MRRTSKRSWTSLKRRADFLRIAASGLRRSTPAFVVQAATAADPAQGVRVGFTCSRKVGNAVARNRAKRRLRALVDEVLAGVSTASLDYVLIGRTDALTRDFAAMTADLRQALARLAPKGIPQGPRS
jgi:ribonuclease P protein component